MRVILAFLVLFAPLVCAAQPAPPDPENTLYLDLDSGRVVIRMRPDLAPKHVERIKHLVRGGFFDGLVFHRVIDGFMAQTGDPKGNGTGGSGRTLDAEFTRTPQVRGTVSMARASAKNSGDSQFFIVLTDNHRADLDGKYTVWGEVVSGMELIDATKKGDARRNGTVSDPDRVIRLHVAADADRPAQRLVSADLLKRPDAAVTARNFGPADFKCAAFGYDTGATAQPALAQLWVHGFLAGNDSAQKDLSFSTTNALDGALQDACKARPGAYLLAIVGQELAKEQRQLPEVTAAFAPSIYTCRDYTAARGGANPSQADFVDLWVFAFIQGYKNVGQPGIEIPFEARAPILAPFAAACAKNPDTKVVALAALLGEKVKVKLK